MGRIHPLGEARELSDVHEEDRHLAFDAGLLLVGITLEELVQDVVVDVAAEGLLDLLFLLEGVAHLVEGPGQLAHLVARRGGDANRDVPRGEPFDADAQTPQRADQECDEADSGEHTDDDHHHRHRGELLRVARDDGVDELSQVELDLGFADEDVAEQDGGPPPGGAGLRAASKRRRGSRDARRDSRRADPGCSGRATRGCAPRDRGFAPPPPLPRRRLPGSACRGRAPGRNRRCPCRGAAPSRPRRGSSPGSGRASPPRLRGRFARVGWRGSRARRRPRPAGRRRAH